MSPKIHQRRRSAGLTLLEVLAAVMIFAMVMSVLVGTSSNAVHHVGLSARRLEADLVANNILSDLEIQIRLGNPSAIEEGEFVDEPFSILISMTEMGADSASTYAPAPPAAGLPGDALSLLSATLPEVSKHLRRYDIDVSWLERNGLQRVTRTTFAFDWQAAQEDLAPLLEAVQKDGSTDQGFGGSELDGEKASNASNSMGSRGPAAGPFARKPIPTPLSGHNARENQLRRGFREKSR